MVELSLDGKWIRFKDDDKDIVVMAVSKIIHVYEDRDGKEGVVQAENDEDATVTLKTTKKIQQVLMGVELFSEPEHSNEEV